MQQTMSGNPFNADYYYLDHVQVAGPACGNPTFDDDRDGDVDMNDFAKFQRCYSGSNVPALAGCSCFSGPDGDVDNGDLSRFVQCATRSGVRANPACDD